MIALVTSNVKVSCIWENIGFEFEGNMRQKNLSYVVLCH